MKQVKLKVNYGRTINLGHYESERIDISLEKEVDEDKWQEESAILFYKVKSEVIKQSKGRILISELEDYYKGE